MSEENIPDGWVLVPSNLTAAMAKALENAEVGFGDLRQQWEPAYRAMLAAAQKESNDA